MSLTNKNWKEYIREKDKVIKHYTASKKAYKWTAFWWGIVWSLPLLITIPLMPLFWFWSFPFYKGMHYVISQKGLYYISGVLFKKIKFIPYSKITDIGLHRGMLEVALYKTGSIGISTAGGTSSLENPYEIQFRYLDDYKKVRDLISEKMS